MAAPAAASPPPAAAAALARDDAGSVVVSGSRVESPGITNVQTQGVDEGGIVKTYGQYLVVLRRGRLFTIDTSGGALRPVAAVNAFAGDEQGSSGRAWYDEMLVAGNMVVVIGYNYGRTGTEINRFRISGAGQLTYVDTHHLRSDDYYSSENYASRLIGSRLIVYAPRNFYYDRDDREEFDEALPAIRRWNGDDDAPFKPLTTPRRVFAADMLLNNPRRANIDTTHSVTDCDLSREELDCRVTVVLGSESRNFYVSQDAVYVWTGDVMQGADDKDEERSILYRIPLNGQSPQAIAAYGEPTNQFSVLEQRGTLNVLVRNDHGGEGMWRSEIGQGDLALLRLPLSQMGRGNRTTTRTLYQSLPDGERVGSLENRFVGDFLLYSNRPYGGGDNKPEAGAVHVVALNGGAQTRIATGTRVTRIDVMGRDAMVIGSAPGNGLAFEAITLSGTPRLEDRYVLPAAREGENRSQAYFYRPTNADGTDGILGLPVTTALSGENERFLGSGSGVFFLNRDQRHLSPAGQLDADSGRAVQDNCLASCTDWYGNARPIFLGDRIIALMGYELVEGRRDNGRIRETQRVSFAPTEPARQPGD